MGNAQAQVHRALEITGALGAMIVDSESGMVLATEGGSAALDLEIAAAGNSEVVKAKRKTMNALRLNDEIEDILITLGKGYHIIRPVRRAAGVFMYLVIDRQVGNLALARRKMAELEGGLEL